jgi:hypothetical protein
MDIEYFAADQNMGDTSADDCSAFRQWAREQLEEEYPAHDIRISTAQSLDQRITNNEENRDEIVDFCSRLWDNCPWDWIETE